MIKSHRPRGHIWTHASAFQQTKQFRNIAYEECLAPRTKALVEDQDENLSAADRATKRRRIEKLASDFLDGNPLFISSARPCPLALKTTIATLKDPENDEEIEVNEGHDSDNELWEDVEDDDEVLKRLTARSTAATSPKLPVDQPDDDVHSHIESVEAQASCRSSKKFRAVGLEAGPSEEALQHAAALRARNASMANNDAPDRRVSIESPAPSGSEPHNVPAPTTDPVQDRWISRRKSRVSFSAYVPDDGSQDELRLSRLETPSAQLRAAYNKAHASSLQSASSAEVLPQQQASYQTALEEYDQRGVKTSAGQRNPLDSSLVPPETTPTRRTKSAIVAEAKVATRNPLLIYVSAPATPHGSTPLQFRKRKTRSMGVKTARLNRPGEAQGGASQSDTGDHGKVSALPMLDMSFHHDSEFAQNLNRALEDEQGELSLVNELDHANTSGVSHRTSHMSPDPESSSPSSDHALFSSAVEQASSILQRDCRDGHLQTWAGTQFLLDKAQHELWNSPQKREPSPVSDGLNTPEAEGRIMTGSPSSNQREPLKQLSQERFPSTQQLLGAFEGWSTVKKPRFRPRYSPSSMSGSPKKGERGSLVTLKGTLATSMALSASPMASAQGRIPIQSKGAMSSTAPPSFPIDAPDATGSPGHRRQTFARSFSEGDWEGTTMSLHEMLPTAQSNALHGEEIETSPGRLLASLEAQEPSTFWREPSNLSQTVNDLRACLETTEMNGVWSQIS